MYFCFASATDFKAYVVSALCSIKARMPPPTIPVRISNVEDDEEENDCLLGLPADALPDWDTFDKNLESLGKQYRQKVVYVILSEI